MINLGTHLAPLIVPYILTSLVQPCPPGPGRTDEDLCPPGGRTDESCGTHAKTDTCCS